MAIKVLHAADFHMDSAFAALSPEQAKLRRRESRTLPERLSNYVNQNGVDIVLLAGDLFDGEQIYRETVEELAAALKTMQAHVFIAPGNHDYYCDHSPYATVEWPENVHVFTRRTVERVDLPELSCAVYGAAFVDPLQEQSLLDGFTAPEDGRVHLMVLHADVESAQARYDPITKEQIAASGLDYLALGHTHECGGVQRAGNTAYAYAGCPEGRGFDELGEKGFLCGTVDHGAAKLDFVPFAKRHYESVSVDVTDRAPEEALREALPSDTVSDVYRITFTGETDERGVPLDALQDRFAPDFFALELRDRTVLRQDLWAHAEDSSLRGLFLQELRRQYDAAVSEEERGKISAAARFGLAAIDGRDI